MFNVFKNFWKTLVMYKIKYQSKKEHINYKSLNDIKTPKKLKEIPLLEYSKNTDKINFLIMDDNEIGVNISIKDVEELNELANILRTKGIHNIPLKYEVFVNKMTNFELRDLSKFDLDKFQLIKSTTDMAGFSVLEMLQDIKIDYAFLDILVGGLGMYKGKVTVIDGIDVANEILTRNPKAKIIFYSGCNINKESSEYIKAKKLLGVNIENIMILKDSDIMKKRLKLLTFLSEY